VLADTADRSSERFGGDTAQVNVQNRRVLALVLGLAGLGLALVVAVPAIGASPPPSKQAKAPEAPVSATGTVARSADGYTLTEGSTTWQLSAGPTWYRADKNPLGAYVGKSVRISGSARADSTELEVETVDGQPIREAGKPPWAGGPWAVGSAHPGWKPWMADGKPGGGHGREDAPGQLKKGD